MTLCSPSFLPLGAAPAGGGRELQGKWPSVRAYRKLIPEEPIFDVVDGDGDHTNAIPLRTLRTASYRAVWSVQVPIPLESLGHPLSPSSIMATSAQAPHLGIYPGDNLPSDPVVVIRAFFSRIRMCRGSPNTARSHVTVWRNPSIR